MADTPRRGLEGVQHGEPLVDSGRGRIIERECRSGHVDEAVAIDGDPVAHIEVAAPAEVRQPLLGAGRRDLRHPGIARSTHYRLKSAGRRKMTGTAREARDV